MMVDGDGVVIGGHWGWEGGGGSTSNGLGNCTIGQLYHWEIVPLGNCTIGQLCHWAIGQLYHWAIGQLHR